MKWLGSWVGVACCCCSWFFFFQGWADLSKIFVLPVPLSRYGAGDNIMKSRGVVSLYIILLLCECCEIPFWGLRRASTLYVRGR